MMRQGLLMNDYCKIHIVMKNKLPNVKDLFSYISMGEAKLAQDIRITHNYI